MAGRALPLCPDSNVPVYKDVSGMCGESRLCSGLYTAISWIYASACLLCMYMQHRAMNLAVLPLCGRTDLALAGSRRTCGLESQQAQNWAQASQGLSPARLIIEETRCLECAQSNTACTVMSLKNIPARDINKDTEPRARVFESHP